jgi:hypothetical protein
MQVLDFAADRVGTMNQAWWRSVVMLAALVLVSASCEATQQQATSSPETSPSVPVTNATPSTAPAESPTPDTAPSPKASPSPAKLIITSVAFHMGEVGLTYATVTAGASGGVKPYKWSISSGALPPGLALSSGGSTTGKPTTAGTFSFVIRVDDSAGSAAGVSRSIFVFRRIAFTSSSAKCTGTYLTGCTTTLKYTGGAGGTPKIKFTLNPATPPLPTGSTITAKAGVVTVVIAAPSCSFPNAVLTLVLTDPSPCTTGYQCTSGPASVAISLPGAC